MQQGDLERMAGRLPETPGINGRNQMYRSAVLVLLTLIDGEYHMVFQKRSADIRQGGEISFPGGGFDAAKDKDFLMTALRETREELGIPENKIRVMGRLDTIVAPMGQVVEVFVGVTDVQPAAMVADEREVEKVFTLPVSFFEKTEPERYYVFLRQHPSYIDDQTGEEVVTLPAKELGLPERYHSAPWGSFKHQIIAYRTPEGTIWGMTARMVEDFVSKTKDK